MSYTFKYKQGYIHISYFNNIEIIYAQVNKYAYVIETPSIHAAKILITKHEKIIKVLK